MSAGFNIQHALELMDSKLDDIKDDVSGLATRVSLVENSQANVRKTVWTLIGGVVAWCVGWTIK